MALACEALATKEELQELREQINQLLGKKETGTPINVLAQGNFDDTLIGEQLDLAVNSIQDIDIQTVNGASITTFDENTLQQLAVGALTLVAAKGKDLYVPLTILTKSVASRAAKIFANIGVGKIAVAGAALTSMSASTMVSLLLIMASLAQSMMNLQVLAARLDAQEKGTFALSDSIINNFNYTASNKKLIQDNQKNLQKNKQLIAQNYEKIATFEQDNAEIKLDVAQTITAIEEANARTDEVKAEVAAFKAEVEAYQGEVNEQIESLKANITQLEENLAVSEENYDNLLVTVEKISKRAADNEAKITELKVELTKYDLQISQNSYDIIQLKKEISEKQIISKSKINGLKAKLVLIEHNLANIDDIEGGYPFIPFPVLEQISNTQSKTLVLANSLSSNPVNEDTLTIPTGTVLKNNDFSTTFDNILSNINIGELGDVNIPELAAEIGSIITPNISTTIDAKIDSLGIPEINQNVVDIKNNTTPINLKKTVEKATTNSICNSTQGQGCLLNHVRQPIQNSVNEGLKKVEDIIDKVQKAIDTEVLETVKDTNKKVKQEFENAVIEKTILAATYTATIHNAAMLSSEVNESVMTTAANIWDNLELKDYTGQAVEPKNWTKGRLDEVESSENHNNEKLNSQNKLFKINPVAPEWWATRVGSERPQLVVVFKPKSKDYSPQTSRWSLTIPHPNQAIKQEDLINLVPNYHKGNTQGLLTLTDNSKLIIYAKNQEEAEKFITTVISKGVIDSKFIPEDYFIKIGNINNKFKELEVTPEMAKFFATGQKNLNPDWITFANT